MLEVLVELVVLVEVVVVVEVVEPAPKPNKDLCGGGFINE